MDEGGEWLRKPETVEELRGLSEDEIKRRYDWVTGYAEKLPPLTREAQPYLERARIYADELVRRETKHLAERMEELTRSLNHLTWWIVVLTVFIAMATLIGVGLTAWAVLSNA